MRFYSLFTILTMDKACAIMVYIGQVTITLNGRYDMTIKELMDVLNTLAKMDEQILDKEVSICDKEGNSCLITGVDESGLIFIPANFNILCDGEVF